MIIDSNFDTNEVLIKNPDQAAPDTIMHTLGLLDVEYLGFDRELHMGQIIIATHVMAEVEAFFKHSIEQEFLIEHVVPVSAPQYRWDGPKVLKDNVSSGFDYRTIWGVEQLSPHAQGLAFDINPAQNPMIRYDRGPKVLTFPKGAKWNPDVPGSLYAEHPLVKLMEGFGWEWGGHWTRESGRTDYMHFHKNY